jgi:hypothetical protein
VLLVTEAGKVRISYILLRMKWNITESWETGLLKLKHFDFASNDRLFIGSFDSAQEDIV